MSKFTKLNKVESVKSNDKVVIIYKFQKVGTKRTFFAPEFEDKMISRTLYARLYDARNLSKQFLTRN